MGWEVVLDTVFELRLLLDSSPVAISRMHNLQLLFIYLDCCCHEHSNLIKEVAEGGRAPSRSLLRRLPRVWGQDSAQQG